MKSESKNMKYAYFAVDFDDTITRKTNFPEIGELRPHADRVLRRIKENGGQIAIWTCRGGEEHEKLVRDFLESNNIPYDGFNTHFDDHIEFFGGTDSPKIFADVYIDDKGLYAQMNGGIDWLQIERHVFSKPKKFTKLYWIEQCFLCGDTEGACSCDY